MALFKKKAKVPEPEPPPPMPAHLLAAWDSYATADDGGRHAIIDRVSEWEATLPPAQQSHLRAEVVATIMTMAGAEVGRVWDEIGIPDGFEKGVIALIVAYEAAAAQLKRRPLREVVWMIPIREHYSAIVGIRDSLIQESRRGT